MMRYLGEIVHRCKMCGRLIYAEDDYRKDEYGAYICSICIEDMQREESEQEEENEDDL